MKPEPGTYALILRSQSKAKVQIGRWGRLELVPGFYVYVGSAFGPGGVRARVLRHWRLAKTKHWHIDYVREYVTPMSVCYSYDAERLEHRWAQTLSQMNGMTSIPDFGCSDCTCASHFFHSSHEPDFKQFSRKMDGSIEKWVFDDHLVDQAVYKRKPSFSGSVGSIRNSCLPVM